jgi:hypothetical protein
VELHVNNVEVVETARAGWETYPTPRTKWLPLCSAHSAIDVTLKRGIELLGALEFAQETSSAGLRRRVRA